MYPMYSNCLRGLVCLVWNAYYIASFIKYSKIIRTYRLCHAIMSLFYESNGRESSLQGIPCTDFGFSLNVCNTYQGRDLDS